MREYFLGQIQQKVCTITNQHRLNHTLDQSSRMYIRLLLLVDLTEVSLQGSLILLLQFHVCCRQLMQHTAPTAQRSGPCQHKVNPTNYWSIATINYKQHRLIFLISYTCKCCMRIMERTFAIQETTPVKQRKRCAQGRKDGRKLALVFNTTENKLFCNSHPNFVTILDFKTCTQLLRLVTEFIIFWERL